MFGDVANPGVRIGAKKWYVLPLSIIIHTVILAAVVIIEATIGPDGRVTDTKVLRSIPLLDQAAVDAVKQWTYTPTLLNGVPVPVIMTVTVNFTLK